MAEQYVSLQTHEEFAKRQDEENKRQNERIKILEETVKEIKDLTISVKGLAENTAADAAEDAAKHMILQRGGLQFQLLAAGKNDILPLFRPLCLNFGKQVRLAVRPVLPHRKTVEPLGEGDDGVVAVRKRVKLFLPCVFIKVIALPPENLHALPALRPVYRF